LLFTNSNVEAGILTWLYLILNRRRGQSSTLLQYKGIVNTDGEVLNNALALYAETTLDPVDCILAG